jgi:hypothetical protein
VNGMRFETFCWHGNDEDVPTDGSASIADGDCYRVERGGSRINGPWSPRGQRYGRFTGFPYFDLGFRIGQTLAP